MAKPTKQHPRQQEVGQEEEEEVSIISVSRKLDAFIATYETDMRGDKDLTNGNKGVIGEIRALKEMFQKYPSIAFSLSKNPGKTLAVIFVIFLILDTLSTFGVLRWVVGLLGVSIPSLPTHVFPTMTPHP